MAATESLIREESLSQRVGHLEQAHIRRPQFDARRGIEQGNNVTVGRTGGKVLNEDTRVDYNLSLGDPDPPSPVPWHCGS